MIIFFFQASEWKKKALRTEELHKLEEKLKKLGRSLRLTRFRQYKEKMRLQNLRNVYLEKLAVLEARESNYVDMDQPVSASMKNFDRLIGFTCHGWECNPGRICSQQEKMFCRDVLQHCMLKKFIMPQYSEIDETGRRYFIDFTIKFPNGRKLAIELDGYTYHAYGKISKKEFDDLLDRDNQLRLEGWIVLHFSWNQYVKYPNLCREVIRKAVLLMRQNG